MSATLNKYTITWIEFRPMIGIATKADCKKMKVGFHMPKQYNGYAYDFFPSKENADYYMDLLRVNLKVRKLSKKYQVRMFTDAQFGRTDMSKSEHGKGYPIKFTSKQEKEVKRIG